MRRTLVGFAILWALAGCGPPDAPPYAFAAQPAQRFRFEAEERIDVDGSVASLSRYADFEIRAQEGASNTTQLELVLDRYFTRVEGAPGGTTELTISERGLSTQTPREGLQRLEPDAASPGGGTIADLRTRPVSGVSLDGDGGTASELWQSSHPVLFGISLMDWWLLAVPTRLHRLEAAGTAGTWQGSREVPQLGQYRVGVEMPLIYRPDPDHAGGVQVSGSIERSALRIAEGLEGALGLEHVGRARFDPRGRLVEATLELRMRFEPTTGGLVTSEHRVRIQALDGTEPVNPDAEEADGPRAT